MYSMYNNVNFFFLCSAKGVSIWRSYSTNGVVQSRGMGGVSEVRREGKRMILRCSV